MPEIIPIDYNCPVYNSLITAIEGANLPGEDPFVVSKGLSVVLLIDGKEFLFSDIISRWRDNYQLHVEAEARALLVERTQSN